MVWIVEKVPESSHGLEVEFERATPAFVPCSSSQQGQAPRDKVTLLPSEQGDAQLLGDENCRPFFLPN